MTTASVAQQLCDLSGRMPFAELPETRNVYYAVWVDADGAAELSALPPEPIAPGIIYVGECVTQSARRHLAHRDIGSLTLMKNLAAIFRESWHLHAARRGSTVHEPGRGRLRDWMVAHLTATIAPRDLEPDRTKVLTVLDPPLRIEGWRPERTDLRRHLTEQRALLDRN